MKNTHPNVTNANNASSQTRCLGVLLVGAGAIAGPYMKFIHENEHLRLAAIADPSPTARAEAEQKYGPVLSVPDYREVLARPDINIVVVCTPHYLHHSMVTSALKVGKHVICEKPLAITVAEADDMLDTAARNNKTLLVTMNMFFSPWAAGIRRLLSERKLGTIFMAQSSYLGYEVVRLCNPHDWKGDLQKAGGGVLLDGGYHIVYLMNSWLGQAKSVQMSGGQYVIAQPHKGEDNAAMLVEYESGAIANLIVSFTVCSPGCHEQPTLHLEHNLWGTSGSMHCSYHWDPRCMYTAEGGYKYGFAGATPGILGGLAMFLVGVTGFCVKPLRQAGVMTIPELFEKRYGRRIRWAAGVVIVLGGLLNMGVFLRVTGEFLVLVCGFRMSALHVPALAVGNWHTPAFQLGYLELMMTILLLLGTIYTVLGGLLSVLVTDFLQFIVMSCGLIGAHFFWWLLTMACVVWYSTITVYVAVKGFADIKEMLTRIEKKQAAPPAMDATDRDP